MWNFRAVRKVTRYEFMGEPCERVEYNVHEAHYSEDGTMRGFTEKPVFESGAESLYELEDCLHRMLSGCSKDTLEWDMFDNKEKMDE